MKVERGVEYATDARASLELLHHLVVAGILTTPLQDLVDEWCDPQGGRPAAISA